MAKPSRKPVDPAELKRLYPDSFAGKMRRSIQPVPVQVEGGPVVVLLNDMAQVSPGQATMALEMFEIVMALDAAGSIGELTKQAVAAGVGLEFGDVVRQLMAELDRALMLEDGPMFKSFRTQYRALPARPAIHAGRSYPEDEAACTKMVADWFAGKYPAFVGPEEQAARDEAAAAEAAEKAQPSKLAQQLTNPAVNPGLKKTRGGIIVPGGFDDEPVAAEPLPEVAASATDAPKPLVTEPPAPAKAQGPVVGMVAPHIDLRRGGPCVAAAYKQLKRADGRYPKLAIVLGTCHHPTLRLATTTGKAFDTPLGEVEVNADALAAFTKALSYDPQEEEYLFIGDFPCEFQALFVADRNARDKAGMQILPVIVGSLENAGCGMNLAEAAPADAKAVQEVVTAIRAAMDAVGGDAVVIASADLSHIGERFENPPVTDAILKEVQAADLEKLKKLETVDAAGFAAAVMQPGNPTNICSTAVIYLAAAALAGKAKTGRLVRHEVSPEAESKSAVSFASVLLEA